MNLYDADTSALARAHVDDEPDQALLRSHLLESEHPLLTSELAGVEPAAAMASAERARRIAHAEVWVA